MSISNNFWYVPSSTSYFRTTGGSLWRASWHISDHDQQHRWDYQKRNKNPKPKTRSPRPVGSPNESPHHEIHSLAHSVVRYGLRTHRACHVWPSRRWMLAAGNLMEHDHKWTKHIQTYAVHVNNPPSNPPPEAKRPYSNMKVANLALQSQKMGACRVRGVTFSRRNF